MGSIPGSGRSSGGGMATSSSIFSWKIPCTGEPGRLQFMGLQRVGQDWTPEHMKNDQLKWIKAKALKKSTRRHGSPGKRLRWPRHYQASHNLGEVCQQNNVPPEFQPHLDVIKLLMTYHWQMFFCQTTRMNLLVHSSTYFASFPIYTCVPLVSVLTLASYDFVTRNLSHLKIMSKQILLLFTKNEFCYCINQGYYSVK